MEKTLICHCELTSELYVLKDGKGCELCDDTQNRQSFTPENVEKAFRFLEKRNLEALGVLNGLV